MKCIYCNRDTDLTVSDIIPAALTGAKLRKKFVCRAHNSFTNNHYEKEISSYGTRSSNTQHDGYAGLR